jgi:threonine dehydrogenase-like Zn-dependent dehydrogenase
MEAAVLSSSRQVEFVSMPLPEPADGQVRIRIQGSGVCGSDLPVWQGRPWFDYPREPGAPGHEAWGVVDAVGPLARDIAVGDRVAGLMYRSYATYDVAEADALVRLPPELNKVPFPGEPLACAVNVVRRSGIADGDVVAIVGIGFLGALVTQLAVAAGAEVIAIGRRVVGLEMASAAGAKHVIPVDDYVAGSVAKLTRNRLCDVVVESAGTQATLDLAGQLVRVRGRLVIAGYHQDGVRSVDMQRWNWNGLDVVNAHERDPRVYREGMEMAVAEVLAGRLDPVSLFTHNFAFDELAQAFGTLEQRPEKFMKALVLMQ